MLGVGAGAAKVMGVDGGEPSAFGGRFGIPQRTPETRQDPVSPQQCYMQDRGIPAVPGGAFADVGPAETVFFFELSVLLFDVAKHYSSGKVALSACELFASDHSPVFSEGLSVSSVQGPFLVQAERSVF